MLPTIDQCIGSTPLIRLQRVYDGPHTVACKLESRNPAGSIKDRPVVSMLDDAEKRGLIRPGGTLIEATSGNTGIALAMLGAIRGYSVCIIMPENASHERRLIMQAYGARIILTPAEDEMEGAVDRAHAMVKNKEGVMLNQFGNHANTQAHIVHTGEEIWKQSQGKVSHFIASKGTTGTITGVSICLKAKNPRIRTIALTPALGENLSGIRLWAEGYQPSIFKPNFVDETRTVTRIEAEKMTRRLGKEEGILTGISSGANVHTAITIAKELEKTTTTPQCIVTIICDGGGLYLSTGIFDVQ